MHHFNTIIKDIHDLLQEDIKNFEEILLAGISKEVNLIYQITTHMYSNKGKFIRPLLTILTAKALSYSGNNHLKLAASLELIHTATLLHDDVIDESKLRRGKETANLVWGNKASILVGDYLFSKSFELMVDIGLLQILEILAKSSNIISQGEIMQLSQIGNLDLPMEEYLEIIKNKTAVLFKSSTYTAAILATDNKDTIDIFHNFGLYLGFIYQIIDDINDYSLNSGNGKNIGDDFKENKVTLPLILLLNQCNKEEKEEINNLFIKTKKNKKDINTIVKLLNKYNSLEKSKEVAVSYYNKLLEDFKKLPDNIYSQKLLLLASSLIK